LFYVSLGHVGERRFGITGIEQGREDRIGNGLAGEAVVVAEGCGIVDGLLQQRQERGSDAT